MRRFVNDKKGQFVVIAALLIAVLTLSLVIAITQVSLNSQELASRPVNELLLGITSDMQRALTHALSQYTYAHYSGQSFQPAFDTMSDWKKALLTSYSSLNLEMNDKFTPDFNSTRWQISSGRSAATLEYSMDVGAYGFRGWTGIVSKYVNLHIYSDTIDTSQSGYTSLVFQLNQSVINGQQTEPIANLTPDLIIVGIYSTGQNVAPASDVKLVYQGNGNYSVTFNEQANSNTKGVSLTLQTPDDGIYISAYYYQDIALTFNAHEKNGLNANLGTIQYLDVNFTGATFDASYNTVPSLLNEKYYLRYYPQSGYEFAGWATNNNIDILFDDASQAITAVTVLGSGSITAIYVAMGTPSPSPTPTPTSTPTPTPTIDPSSTPTPTPTSTTTPPNPTPSTSPTPTPSPTLSTQKIVIDSLSWNASQASHQGTISFNATTYSTLPQIIAVNTTSYRITYNPPNSNCQFLYWQFSGAIASMSSQGQTMTVMLYGNATATAVYIVTNTTPVTPPYDGEWNSLFFDNMPEKQSLVPYYMWSQLDSHDVTHSSTGNLKQVSTMQSPILSPKITMADYVNLTIYMRPTPPNSVKSLEMAIGFNYNGNSYSIASATFNPNPNILVYTASMNVQNLDLGFGKQVIPEGAIITITNTVTFIQQNGFNFIYNGADTPSRLDLY